MSEKPHLTVVTDPEEIEAIQRTHPDVDPIGMEIEGVWLAYSESLQRYRERRASEERGND